MEDLTMHGFKPSSHSNGKPYIIQLGQNNKVLQRIIVNSKGEVYRDTPNDFSLYDFSGITSIDQYALQHQFGGVTGAVIFPALTEVGPYGLCATFANCTGITSVSFPELITINGQNAFEYAFQNCECSSLSFPKLKTISGSSAMYSAFYGCSNLTTVSFPALTEINSSSVSGMFSSCTNLTELHLKSTLSSSSLTVSNFGLSSNAQLIYDL